MDWVASQTSALERGAVLGALVAATLVSWLYLVPASADMYGDMNGLSAWMMTAEWDARYAFLIFLMWAVMMVGMMLPSAASTVLLFHTVVRNQPNPDRPVRRSYAFALGYLLAWAAFSALATAAQWALARLGLLSPMMETTGAWLGPVLLIAAGVYQWTPLKQACLTHCRSPLSFLSHAWRPGVSGALRVGLDHGLYCIGCCWSLMLLLFVGGVMSLVWIAGITVFVLVEKLLPFGDATSRIGGVLLVLGGASMLVF